MILALQKYIFCHGCQVQVGLPESLLNVYLAPMVYLFLISWFSLLVGPAGLQYVYSKISMEMHSRTVHKGRVNAMKARVYYTAEGKMASYFYEPEEMLVTNTTKGDMSVYTFKTNTVMQRQNFNFGTQSNQLFFFLEDNRTDLGLNKLGFTLKDTRFENGLKITRWQPPLQMAKDVDYVELAHEKGNPIFLGYFNKKKQPLNKVFFYNYVTVVGHSFPASMTQILFIKPGDSTVTKTTYSNFKVDQEVNDEYLNFKIPADARVSN